jgi:hypothetical protein
MIAWVVIDRRHPRQSRKPSAIRPFPFSFLLHRRLNIWTLRSNLRGNCGAQIPTLSGRSDAPFHLPYLLPSSVSRKAFACHSYENCRVCTNNSHSGTHLHQAKPRAARHSPLYSSSFFSHPCALFCSFLYLRKTQPICFQMLPHSLPKITLGVEEWPHAPLTLIGFPSPHPIKSPHRPHHERKRTRQDEATS